MGFRYPRSRQLGHILHFQRNIWRKWPLLVRIRNNVIYNNRLIASAGQNRPGSLVKLPISFKFLRCFECRDCLSKIIAARSIDNARREVKAVKQDLCLDYAGFKPLGGVGQVRTIDGSGRDPRRSQGTACQQ